MFKIYSINNEGNQVPSIEYINELIKIIEDEIKTLNTNFTGFPSIETDAENLETISADKIKTDPRHRFINEALLTTFVNKPSNFDIEQSLDAVKQELRNDIEKSYMRILNTPNAIAKLRDIYTILNDNDALAGLMNTLSYKVNTDDLNEHKNSNTHLNNNDRKALNILLKCVMDSFADWNAKDGEVNSIKNKPTSLPANGGNADTISNHGISDIINKNTDDLVIGTSASDYGKDTCDIYTAYGDLNSDLLGTELFKLNKNGGTILFKKGYYKIKSIDAQFQAYPIIFNGVDRKLTTIEVSDSIKLQNTTFRNIKIKGATVIIKSDVDLENVIFDNCTITLSGSENCNINGCTFKECKITISSAIRNNIIKHNRFVYTNSIKYLGGNNIITENIV